MFEIDFGCDKVSPLTCSPSEKKKKFGEREKDGLNPSDRERERERERRVEPMTQKNWER